MIFAIDTIFVEEVHSHKYKNMPNGGQEEMMRYIATYRTPVLKKQKRREFLGMGPLFAWLKTQNYKKLRPNGRVDAGKWSQLEIMLQRE